MEDRSKGPSAERKFNDDLLTNIGDLHYAKSQFPRVFALLDHEELRSVFLQYEIKANKAHSYVHRLGLAAVAFAALALLSAATQPLWSTLRYANIGIIVFELFGLLAALVAGTSLWVGPWRRRWLESRFMAERVRQWHFQMLVRKGHEVEVALADSASAVDAFRKLRQTWFSDFLHEYGGKLDSRMDSLANDPDFSADWLHRPTDFRFSDDIFNDLTEAYRRLRFSHQYDYSTYKLSTSIDDPPWHFLKWPLLRQQSTIQTAVSLCFVTAFLSSIAVILTRYFGLSRDVDVFLSCVTLVIAVLGIAFRTVQEGLAISKDIERYRDYRGKVRRLLLCFEETEDRSKKLRLMEELELAAVDELRGFLRAHREAGFAL